MKKIIFFFVATLLFSISAISQVTPSGGISGSGTTNYIPKFLSSKKIGNSKLSDNGTNIVALGTFSINKPTVGTGAKGLSVNFATIGETFYIDDNGYAKYYGGGFTIAGSNSILNLVSNGGTNPSLSFKYNNGASNSGTIRGESNSLLIDAAAVTFSQATADKVAIFDGSKNLISSSTTTTQLGYLDATSSVQTQLDEKANNALYKVNTPISVTGTTVETVVFSYSIAAGKIQENDFLDFLMFGTGTNNANIKSIRIYASETNTLTGATQLAFYSTTTNSGGVFTFHRFWTFQNSLSSQKICNAATSTANDLVSQSNVSETTTTLNATNTIYIFLR